MAGYSHHNHLTSRCLSDSSSHRITTVDAPPKPSSHRALSRVENQPTMSYKVEELLALRDSVSESAVSIDKFADEDVIKGQWRCSVTFTLHHTRITPPHQSRFETTTVAQGTGLPAKTISSSLAGRALPFLLHPFVTSLKQLSNKY